MRNLFMLTLIAFTASQDRSKPASREQVSVTTPLPTSDTAMPGKGMINEQYRMDLVIGYDRKSDCPVFLESNQDLLFYDAGERNSYSGKLYKWTPRTGARPALTKKGNPIEFNGFQSMYIDTLLLTTAVFPDH